MITPELCECFYVSNLLIGNCSSAIIDLVSHNRLSRFASGVFQPVMEQMNLRSNRFGVGSIEISENNLKRYLKINDLVLITNKKIVTL